MRRGRVQERLQPAVRVERAVHGEGGVRPALDGASSLFAAKGAFGAFEGVAELGGRF